MQDVYMDKINQALKEIAATCNEKHYSIVTAESCTGGGLAYFITKNPESSFILERGYITYSIPSKEEILNVSTYLLQTFGAVSKEVSIEMAEKALSKSKAQISIAITGIDHDVIKEEGINMPGTAWISCSSIDNKTISKQFNSNATREDFCVKLILYALEMLKSYIK